MPYSRLSGLVWGLMALGLALVAPAEARAPAPANPPFAHTIDLKHAVDAALKDRAQGHRVLVVFDIDNTLLTLPKDLGSDAWFSQKAANDIPKSPDPDAAFAEVLKESNLLLNAARMEKTQDDADKLVQALQAKHIPVFALSARDPALRGATERELKRNGIDLSTAPDCGPPLCLRRGNITEADIARTLKRLKLTAPKRPLKYITISDGVIMVQGQDKGLTLHLVLHSLSKRRFDDIYFIDDTPHNIESMVNAAPHLHARVHIFQYERMWPKVAAYKADTQRHADADAQFGAIRNALCTAMDSGLCDIGPSAGAAH